MKKERIEDLGRLAVMLRKIFHNDIFYKFPCSKYAVEKMREMTEERRDDFIHEIADGIEEVHDRISECLCIADGDGE
jgi:hypothetical protein